MWVETNLYRQNLGHYPHFSIRSGTILKLRKEAKGQLISKEHFVQFSPKNERKKFCPTRLGQKVEFSR